MNSAPTDVWLTDEEYRFVFSKVPRLCVDLVVRTEQGVLLALRAIDPYRGMWHLPGGMVYKGESFLDAARRIAKKETGLDVASARISQHIEMLNEERIDHVQHIVSLICEVELGKEGESMSDSAHAEMRPDFQSSELKFFSEIPENTISFHKEVLMNYLK